MERDWDEMIREQLAAREGRVGAGPDLTTVVAAVGTARRARVRRTALTATAAVATVVVAAGVVGAVQSRTRTAGEVEPPGPSVSATPTPSTSSRLPSSSPTVLTQAQLDAGYGLPPLTPAPPDLWDRVGPGWAVAVYTSSWSRPADAGGLLRNTVVLASPEGDLYRVHELPLDVDVRIVHWEPGASRALVLVATEQKDGLLGQSRRGWLDLTDPRSALSLGAGITVQPGSVGAPDEQGVDPVMSLIGTTADGDEVWSARYDGAVRGDMDFRLRVARPDGTAVVDVDLGDSPSATMLDPQGRRAVAGSLHDDGSTFRIVDLATGASTAVPFGVPGRSCSVVAWRDEHSLLAVCVEGAWEKGAFDLGATTGAYRLVDVHDTGGVVSTVMDSRAGDPPIPLGGGTTLPDGEVAVVSPMGLEDPCSSRTYVVADRAMRRDDAVGASPVVVAGQAAGTRYDVVVTRCGIYRESSTEVQAVRGGERTTILPGGPDSLGAVSWAIAGGPSGWHFG